MDSKYISSVEKQLLYYKQLAESAMNQVSDKELFSSDYSTSTSRYNSSMGLIVKHICGNMKSRWTNVFEEDGEKEWRDRDDEFTPSINSREELLELWESSWKIFTDLVSSLANEDLYRIVYIRNMGHTLTEAINRQLMHYAYHIGQVVLIAKQYRGDQWKSLSIPLGTSKEYNASKFSQEKTEKNFIDDLLS
ncbi:DUF1572 domain-containing protein [Saprospiraceae bacterium]|nr:DUF1572 domain-containing protein [Saprospiraceae bacterium]